MACFYRFVRELDRANGEMPQWQVKKGVGKMLRLLGTIKPKVLLEYPNPEPSDFFWLKGRRLRAGNHELIRCRQLRGKTGCVLGCNVMSSLA